VLGVLTNNIGWKLLSLAAAFLLWFSVASEPELATLHAVPVEYKSIPDDLEISSDVREYVTLEMRGPAGRLLDVPDGRSAVILDFSSVHQPGERTFDVDSRNVSLPRGIHLVRVIPAQLTFTFERRVTREVPVEIHLSQPHQGYTVVSNEAVPPNVVITGPASAVNRTASVITDPVDISGVVSNAQYRVNTHLIERLARYQTSSYVTVRVVVKKK
jgi:YbbR domain-containing protein